MRMNMETEYYGLPVKEFIENALREDVGDGDQTSLATIPENSVSKAAERSSRTTN